MTSAPTPWTSPRRAPGAATAAAVLGLVEAGLGTAVLLGALAVPGAPTPAVTTLLLTTPVITALLLVGSFSVLRGNGRRLLLGTSGGEVVFVLGLAGWSLADPSGPYVFGTGDGLVAAVVLSALVGAALPVVRMVLAAQPSVGVWVRHRSQVWAPRRTGLIAALLIPVALMMAASIWVVAAPGQVDYAGVHAAAPADWGVLYDDGVPVTPPSSGHPAYDAAFDGDARSCHDGDMGACDELFFSTPSGSFYEWLGSTCGGRESRGTYGLLLLIRSVFVLDRTPRTADSPVMDFGAASARSSPRRPSADARHRPARADPGPTGRCHAPADAITAGRRRTADVRIRGHVRTLDVTSPPPLLDGLVEAIAPTVDAADLVLGRTFIAEGIHGLPSE